MKRDPNVMISGVVYALTVVLAITPGRERELRRRIRDWKQSPFARLPGTHFARLVVLDELVYEGPRRRRPQVPLQYLLFSATFDGTSSAARDKYLERMCRRLPDEVEGVFALCAGAPCPLAGNPVPFRRWLVANQVDVGAFFAHRPSATLPDVRRALTLRRRLRSFAFRNTYRRPDELQRNFNRAFP